MKKSFFPPKGDILSWMCCITGFTVGIFALGLAIADIIIKALK